MRFMRVVLFHVLRVTAGLLELQGLVGGLPIMRILIYLVLQVNWGASFEKFVDLTLNPAP